MTTLYLYECEQTDVARSSSLSSLNLNDASTFALIGYIPVISVPDAVTGQYPDVWETIRIRASGSGMNAKQQALVTLEAWARKCGVANRMAGLATVIWLKYQEVGATNAVWAKVKALGVQPREGTEMELRVLREGLWWGDYATAYVSNLFTARAQSSIRLINHMDALTHVYDYDNAGAASPWTAGSFSVNKPTYILGNAKNSAASVFDGIQDAVYFGCTDASFAGFALDIANGASYTATLTWEYSAGSVWTAFTPTDGTGGFKTAGSGLVAITGTSLAGWAATAVNSVTAYWMRARVSASTSSGCPCTLQNSTTVFGLPANYLSAHANWLMIDDADVKGDAPALCQVVIQSLTSAAGTTRLARRSVGHGKTVWAVTSQYAEATGGTSSADSTAWRGDRMQNAAAASTYGDGATSMALGTYNVGLWRPLLRAQAATTASTAYWRSEVKLGTTGATLFQGSDVVAPIAGSWAMLDLGVVPTYPPAGNTPANFQVNSEYKKPTGAVSQVLYEDGMMLMPLDEFYHVATPAANSTSYKVIMSGMDDSSFVSSAAYNGMIYEVCEPMGMPLVIEPNRDNYLFLLCDRANLSSHSEDEYDVTVYVIPRFTAVRGGL